MTDFSVTRGKKQGRQLQPVLFGVFIDYLSAITEVLLHIYPWMIHKHTDKETIDNKIKSLVNAKNTLIKVLYNKLTECKKRLINSNINAYSNNQC